MAWFEHGTSRIYCETYGSGDPVLLLPGWAGSVNDLAAIREALSAHYHVIVADLPGSGRSEPLPRAYTRDYYEEDARSLTALLQRLATGPAHLVGFSDGGEVELLMAAFTPGLARSVVTWGSAGSLTDAHLPMVQAMAKMLDEPGPPFTTFREYVIAQYGEANARATLQSFSAAARAIIESGGDISVSKASAITCPVLLIVGDRDFIVSPEMVSRLAAQIPGAETVVLEGAGHAVHDDRPEWLEQTLLEWLKDHPGSQ